MQWVVEERQNGGQEASYLTGWQLHHPSNMHQRSGCYVADQPMFDGVVYPLFLLSLLHLSLLQVAEIEAAEKNKMKEKCEKIIGHGINCFINRQLIYNYPEEIFADAGTTVTYDPLCTQLTPHQNRRHVCGAGLDFGLLQSWLRNHPYKLNPPHLAALPVALVCRCDVDRACGL
jgi:hypothetical protein